MAAKAMIPLEIGGVEERLAKKDDSHQDTYGKLAYTYAKHREEAGDRALKFRDYLNHEQDPEKREMWSKELDKAIADYERFKFGHEALDIPQSKYPQIYAIRNELDDQFLARYTSERPAYSSPMIFTAKMQAVFNAIAYDVEQKLIFYAKVKTLFNEPMGTRIGNFFYNTGETNDSAYDLPDVPSPQEFAHLKNNNKRKDGGYRETIDDTIPTKLTNMLSLANVSLNIMPGYLNAFSHLFMTVVY